MSRLCPLCQSCLIKPASKAEEIANLCSWKCERCSIEHQLFIGYVPLKSNNYELIILLGLNNLKVYIDLIFNHLVIEISKDNIISYPFVCDVNNNPSISSIIELVNSITELPYGIGTVGYQVYDNSCLN